MPYYYNSDFKLAARKKIRVICFPLGLIYCDQEPLRLLNAIELLTRCKICFTLELFANYFSQGGGWLIFL